MDSKTLATILIVIICILLFPVFVGIIGGIFGVIGSIFGVFGSVIGAVFGAIGAVVGAVFGAFGWMFNDHDYWHNGYVNRQLFTLVIVFLIILAIARSRKEQARTGGDRHKKP